MFKKAFWSSGLYTPQEAEKDYMNVISQIIRNLSTAHWDINVKYFKLRQVPEIDNGITRNYFVKMQIIWTQHIYVLN